MEAQAGVPGAGRSLEPAPDFVSKERRRSKPAPGAAASPCDQTGSGVDKPVVESMILPLAATYKRAQAGVAPDGQCAALTHLLFQSDAAAHLGVCQSRGPSPSRLNGIFLTVEESHGSLSQRFRIVFRQQLTRAIRTLAARPGIRIVQFLGRNCMRQSRLPM